jgi:allantoicase
MTPDRGSTAQAGLDVDLASRWLGGSVLGASDESFGEKENLLNRGSAAFEPGRYGPRGEIVDGWETRRRRTPGHDWALVRLGIPGTLTSVDIDTSHFIGNFPPFARLEACGREGYPGPDELLGHSTEWVEIVPQVPLEGDAHNVFRVDDRRRFTHLRLSSYPDGGIARLRVHGTPLPDPREFDGLTIDLASVRTGATVAWSSDEFFTSAQQLIRPDRARSMGEGWETRRRRDGGHDSVIIKLGLPGRIQQLIVDTSYFRYNASSAIEVLGSPDPEAAGSDEGAWRPILGRTALQPDTRHLFRPLPDRETVAAIRIDAYPDGGLSRIGAVGTVDPVARHRTGYRWFNTLPDGHARECLELAALSSAAIETALAARPLAEGWLKVDAPSAPLGDADLVRLASILEGR